MIGVPSRHSPRTSQAQRPLTADRVAKRLKLAELRLVLHAWGMGDKHSFEARGTQMWWSVALYWICWLALAGLALYAIARALNGG